MSLSFPDSDWERVNYEEESSPIIVKRLDSVEIMDEDEIASCDMSEDDTCMYQDDNGSAAKFRRKPAGNSKSQSGPAPELRLRNPTRLRFEAMKALFFEHPYYCKYVKDNSMKQAALFTSLVIMLLPLFLMVLITILLILFLVFLAVFVPVIAFCVAFVVLIMWNVWISVPLFLMLVAVWIGAEIFDRLVVVSKEYGPWQESFKQAMKQSKENLKHSS